MKDQHFDIRNCSYEEIFSEAKDGEYDLAICDPPYGIGQNWTKDRKGQFYNHRNDFNNSIPNEKYFNELFRVSKHQIIWGCNYYWNYLRPTNNIIFWDKGKDAFTQFGSAGELAWTSITKYPLVKVELNWNGCVVCEKSERVHPHQKPVKLYTWQIKHYAKPGYKILDTHGGSLSIALAVDYMNTHHNMNLYLTCSEIDTDYYNTGIKRLINARSQIVARF